MDTNYSFQPKGPAVPVVPVVLIGLLIGMDMNGVGGALTLGSIWLVPWLLSLLVSRQR